VARTLANPQDVEVILVVDANDPASSAVSHQSLNLRQVVVPPGLTMGSLNMAGYEACRGTYVMLLNDDVIIRTRRWDERVRACLRRLPDDIALIHVNDTLFRDKLCTFPLVSRVFCEICGGVCPREYSRYRIDDHIEDIFNLMSALGKRRTFYLPDLVFEHCNTIEDPRAGRVYASQPSVLALDDRRFEALSAARKEVVLRLLEYIEGLSSSELVAVRRRQLAKFNDPFYLRKPGRQRVDQSGWLRYGAYRWRQSGGLASWACALASRARACAERKGLSGLASAVGRRLGTGGLRQADLRRLAWEARYPALPVGE
jgi:hypothetical protein